MWELVCVPPSPTHRQQHICFHFWLYFTKEGLFAMHQWLQHFSEGLSHDSIPRTAQTKPSKQMECQIWQSLEKLFLKGRGGCILASGDPKLETLVRTTTRVTRFHISRQYKRSLCNLHWFFVDQYNLCGIRNGQVILGMLFLVGSLLIWWQWNG